MPTSFKELNFLLQNPKIGRHLLLRVTSDPVLLNIATLKSGSRDVTNEVIDAESRIEFERQLGCHQSWS